MTIAPAILKHYPDLNEAQREVVSHLDGPLLVVAGPGSGKTYSIVLRALNLLLLGIAAAKEIVLCTFTEKAAFEMRDRLSAAAKTVDYRGDLSELRVTTIHGLCNRILMQRRHRTELGNSYETLRRAPWSGSPRIIVPTAPSSSAMTVGWPRLTGLTRTAFPFASTRPSRPIRTAGIRTTRRASAYGDATRATKLSASPSLSRSSSAEGPLHHGRAWRRY